MGNFKEELDLLKTRVANRFSELRNMQDVFEFVTQEELENGEYDDYFDVTNDITGDVFEATIMKVDLQGIKIHDIGNGTTFYVGLNDLASLEYQISLVELMEHCCIPKESTTYFLFGSDAIRIFEEGNQDEKTMTGLKLGDIEYTVCEFVQNSSDPESLLSDFSGWQDFLVITKEQYEFLK